MSSATLQFVVEKRATFSRVRFSETSEVKFPKKVQRLRGVVPEISAAVPPFSCYWSWVSAKFYELVALTFQGGTPWQPASKTCLRWTTLLRVPRGEENRVVVSAEPEVRSRDPRDFLLNLTSPLPKKGRRGSSCQSRLQKRPSSEVRPFARNPFPNVALLGNVEARVPKKRKCDSQRAGASLSSLQTKGQKFEKPRPVVSTRQKAAPRTPVVALPATPVRRALRAVAKFRENAKVPSQKTNAKVRRFTETKK